MLSVVDIELYIRQVSNSKLANKASERFQFIPSYVKVIEPYYLGYKESFSIVLLYGKAHLL